MQAFVVLVFASGAARLLGWWRAESALTSLCAVLGWLRFVYLCRLVEYVGPVVMIVDSIVRTDLVVFVFVYIVIAEAFAQASVF